MSADRSKLVVLFSIGIHTDRWTDIIVLGSYTTHRPSLLHFAQ